MNLIENLSKSLLQFIIKNSPNSIQDQEILKYGIQVILINIIKFIIVVIAALLLRNLKYTIIFLFAFAAVRCFVSGIHAKSSLNCTVANLVIFVGLPYLNVHYPLNKYILSILFIICFIIILIYAPADTKEKPIVSKKIRNKLKIKSLSALLVLLFLVMLFNNNIYSTLIINAIFVASLCIMPITYNFFGKEYKNYEKL